MSVKHRSIPKHEVRSTSHRGRRPGRECSPGCFDGFVDFIRSAAGSPGHKLPRAGVRDGHVLLCTGFLPLSVGAVSEIRYLRHLYRTPLVNHLQAPSPPVPVRQSCVARFQRPAHGMVSTLKVVDLPGDAEEPPVSGTLDGRLQMPMKEPRCTLLLPPGFGNPR